MRTRKGGGEVGVFLARTKNLPFRATTDTILDDLCLLDRSNLFKESNQLLSSQTSSKLLDEYGATIAFVLVQMRALASGLATAVTATTAIPAASPSMAMIASIPMVPATVAVPVLGLIPVLAAALSIAPS
jgi:hypothetical protein